MKAVFDTNIVIDLLSGHPPALAELGRYSEVFISRITWIEVLIGAPSVSVQEKWEDFLGHFHTIELTESVCREAIHLRKQSKVKLPDALIWATARVNHASLVTRNTKDFSVQTEGVVVPYQK